MILWFYSWSFLSTNSSQNHHRCPKQTLFSRCSLLHLASTTEFELNLIHKHVFWQILSDELCDIGKDGEQKQGLWASFNFYWSFSNGH